MASSCALELAHCTSRRVQPAGLNLFQNTAHSLLGCNRVRYVGITRVWLGHTVCCKAFELFSALVAVQSSHGVLHGAKQRGLASAFKPRPAYTSKHCVRSWSRRPGLSPSIVILRYAPSTILDDKPPCTTTKMAAYLKVTAAQPAQRWIFWRYVP
jgi:hypothetical protein